MALEETRFASLCSQLLSRLADVAEEAGLDSEISGNVLTIEMEDGRHFIVNGNAPLRQIWLASPVSGASHYQSQDDGETWLSTRGGDNLLDVLAADVKKATGLSVAF